MASEPPSPPTDRQTAMAMRLTDLCPVTITMNFMPAIAAKLGNCQSTATATVTAGSRATGYWETRSSFLLLEQHWQYIWAIKISFPTIRLYGLAQYNVTHIHVCMHVCMYGSALSVLHGVATDVASGSGRHYYYYELWCCLPLTPH